jgi:hypothetical protein
LIQQDKETKLMRQKSRTNTASQATSLEILQEKVFNDSDIFCAFGVGLTVGVLIGLTYSCIILL